MAVRHEFGGEMQSREAHDQVEPQNAPGPRVGKTENIDVLVSRFLEELSDITSELAQDEKPGTNSHGAAETGNVPLGAQLQPPALSPGPDPDLEEINAEIERSLIELESLGTDSANPEPIQAPEIRAMPVGEVTQVMTQIEPPKKSSPVVPEEVVWSGLELFRTSIAAQRARRSLWFGLILAGIVLIGILGFTALYFLNP
jgi:hypothetical protein